MRLKEKKKHIHIAYEGITIRAGEEKRSFKAFWGIKIIIF